MLGVEDLGTLKEGEENADSPVLRAQLLEKDRENDKVGSWLFLFGTTDPRLTWVVTFSSRCR